MGSPVMPEQSSLAARGGDMNMLQRMGALMAPPSAQNSMQQIYTLQWSHAMTRSIIDRVFAGPMVQAQGMMYNPASLSQTVYQGSAALADYRNNLYATRAMLGRSVVDEGRFNNRDFVDQISRQGTVKTEVLDAMKQLAMYSGKLAENLQQAATNITTFAKATGQSSEMFSRAFGAAGLGTRGIADTDTQQARLLANVLKMNGNNNMLIQPYMSSIEAFRELQRQSGGMPEARGNTENAQIALARMISLNPGLYGARPDLAVQHSAQITALGKTALLPIALQIARRQGGTGADGKGEINFENVLADLESNEDYMNKGLQSFLGNNRGYREYLELRGALPANLGRRLGMGGGEAKEFVGAGNSDVAKLLADMGMRAPEAVTEVAQANAGATNKFSDATTAFAKAVTAFSKTVADFQGEHPVGSAAIGGVLGGITSLLGLAGGGWILKKMGLLGASALSAEIGAGTAGAGAVAGTAEAAAATATAAEVAAGTAAAGEVAAGAVAAGEVAAGAAVGAGAGTGFWGAASATGYGLAAGGLTLSSALLTAPAALATYTGMRISEEAAATMDAYDAMDAASRDHNARMQAYYRSRRGGTLGSGLPGRGTNSISSMKSDVQSQAEGMLEHLRGLGYHPIVTSTFRDEVRTNAIYASQGRTKPYAGAGGHGDGTDLDFTGEPEMYRAAERYLRANRIPFKNEGDHIHVAFQQLSTVADGLANTTASLQSTARLVQDSTSRMAQDTTGTSGRRQAAPRP